MDETPIFFEMCSNTTIAKIGQKTVNIRKFGTDKTRLTLILCISSLGDKLPPLVIFKGNQKANKEKKLGEYIMSKKYNLVALCQENA